VQVWQIANNSPVSIVDPQSVDDVSISGEADIPAIRRPHCPRVRCIHISRHNSFNVGTSLDKLERSFEGMTRDCMEFFSMLTRHMRLNLDKPAVNTDMAYKPFVKVMFNLLDE
jgi:hypothetical protein